MNKNSKFQLTPEQYNKIKNIKHKLELKLILYGIEYGAMAVLINFILIMVCSLYFKNNKIMIFSSAVLVGIFIVRRLMYISILEIEECIRKIDKIINNKS